MSSGGLTRAQKRAIRKEAKAADAGNKSVRLLEKVAAQGGPRVLNGPGSRATPRLGANPGSIFDMKMEYSVENKDVVGDWSWGHARSVLDSDWDRDIAPFLATMSQLTWKDISTQRANGRQKHHEHEVAAVCSEAQTRWIEIDLAQYDTAYRFRVNATGRLWGFRLGHLFRIVWWDPQHNVYPTEPAS